MYRTMAYPLYQVAIPDTFPALGEIPEPPQTLYVRGTLPEPHVKKIVIVGSRALTEYGAQACRTLISGLAGAPVSIVSGLALGTDALAHRCALENKLHTIAMPGSSICDEDIAPRTNAPLAQDILKKNGALVSEFAPGYTVGRHSFPQRNRLMAGIADAVIVIQAHERSGTLITARLANEYNRELGVVPHPITSAEGVGSNAFLKLGAHPLTAATDILDLVDLPYSQHHLADLTHDEERIYAQVKTPQSREALARALELSKSQVSTLLSTLELKGYIREEAGKIRRS